MRNKWEKVAFAIRVMLEEGCFDLVKERGLL